MANDSQPQLFTLKQLHEETSAIIGLVFVSGEPAVITRRGRLLAMITPIPEGSESQLLAEYLKNNPLPE